MPQATATRFVQDILENPNNRVILERLPSLELPDTWLVAGCLFQTVWNLQSGKPPESGIKDYDLFYFDASDLSEAAEARVSERVVACFHDLGVEIEAKNQARVHTWYRDWFGHDYPALTSAQDGIQRFLVPCTCVGLQPQAGQAPVLFAPYGLDDLYAGILRPNPLINHRELFHAKAQSYRARWPRLQIIEQEG